MLSSAGAADVGMAETGPGRLEGAWNFFHSSNECAITHHKAKQTVKQPVSNNPRLGSHNGSTACAAGRREPVGTPRYPSPAT